MPAIRMSNSALATFTQISPNRDSPRNKKIDTITIHHMAGNLTVERCGQLFASPSRKGSSNYGVDTAGKIGLYVPESDRAWTSSNPANDHRAITIEVANDQIGEPWHVSETAIIALVKLCADICRRNGIKKLVWSDNKDDRVNHRNGCNMTVHRDFAATACPGTYLYSQIGRIANAVNHELVAGDFSKDVTVALWRVQTGAFKKKDNAFNMLNKLRKKGYDGIVVLSNGLFKVQLGAFKELANAEKLSKTVHVLGFDTFITDKGGEMVAER